MPDFAVKPLGPLTWADFAALVERHNGVSGGCWCLEFHAEGAKRGGQRRAQKECGVRDGSAHAALVYGGGTVESYPEDAVGRTVSASFLHNGGLSMFEQQGFARVRPIGKNHWVVAKTVPAKRQ